MDCRFPTVGYATKERVESATQFVAFDDRGALERSGGKLRFGGKKGAIEMSEVVAIDLRHQKPNRVVYVLASIALCVYVAAIVYFLLDGAPVGGMAAIVAVGIYLNLLLRSGAERVRVSYHDAGGAPGEAYFANTSALGCAGLLGGTRRLFVRLKGGR